LLAEATMFVRPYLDRSKPVGERLKALWAGVVAARDYGAADVVESEFTAFARDAGLTADLGHHGEADVRHIVRWGMLHRNPFSA
jgi:hypothetical protein